MFDIDGDAFCYWTHAPKWLRPFLLYFKKINQEVRGTLHLFPAMQTKRNNCARLSRLHYNMSFRVSFTASIKCTALRIPICLIHVVFMQHDLHHKTFFPPTGWGNMLTCYSSGECYQTKCRELMRTLLLFFEKNIKVYKFVPHCLVTIAILTNRYNM